MDASTQQDPRFNPVQVQTSKGQTLQVREYTFQDFKPLVEMYLGFVPKREAQGLPPAGLRRIAHWLDRLQHESRALIAWGGDGKRLVAHALLCPISDAAVELAVFVHQDYRRAGLGTKLSELAIGLASQSGFAEVVVMSELTNLAAIGLYRKVGFNLAKNPHGGECELRMSLVHAEQALSEAA